MGFSERNWQGFVDGSNSVATFYSPTGIAVDPASGTVFVADEGNNAIRSIALDTGDVTTLCGGYGNNDPSSEYGFGSGYSDGVGTLAAFAGPRGLAFDPSTGTVFVADYGNHAIRTVSSDTGDGKNTFQSDQPFGVVATLAGSGNSGSVDGTGTLASFSFPSGVAVDPSTGTVFVADYENHLIRAIAIDTTVTTLAGDTANGYSGAADGIGALATFHQPADLAVDAATGTLFVADWYNNVIRTIAIDTGAVATLAGGGSDAFNGAGFDDGVAEGGTFYKPGGVAFDPASGTC